MFWSKPQVIANPPLLRVSGKVCGNFPGGAGISICAGTLLLLGQPRSVVGMVCMSVKRGAQAAVSIPAGLDRVVAKPNDPAWSNVSNIPWPILSYPVPNPARITVLPPSPKRLLRNPSLPFGDQATASRGPKSLSSQLQRPGCPPGLEGPPSEYEISGSWLDGMPFSMSMARWLNQSDRFTLGET